MILASTDLWFSSADFWIGTAIGVFGVVVTIFLWRLGVPRAVLYYWIASDAALVSSTAVPGLKVLLNDQEVDSPHLVRLRVRNQSRRDIRSADFDADESLRFAFGVPVLGLLLDSDAADGSPASFIAVGNEVLVRPMLIRRKADLTVDVLTEGEPKLSCDSPLADVTDRLGQPREPFLWSKITGWTVAILISLYVVTFPRGAAGGLDSEITFILSGAIVSALLLIVLTDWRLRNRR